jgi:hypothetical protein
MSAENVARLGSALPSGARDATANIVSSIVHDVRTPAAAVTMEIFSARLLIRRLSAAAREANSDDVAALEETAVVLTNIERATCSLLDYIDRLQALAEDLRATRGGEPRGDRNDGDRSS